MGKSKKGEKRKRSKRLVFLDVVIVEADEIVTYSRKEGDMKCLKKPFCCASVGNQEIATSQVASSKNTNSPLWNQDCTFTMADDFEELVLELWDKRENLKANLFLGQVAVDLCAIPFNELVDTWIVLEPPPSCETRDKVLVSGRIHLKLFKSRKVDTMLLSHFGEPLTDFPIRLSAGDIVLCSNRTVLTATVHLSTRSQWDHVAMVVKRRDRKGLRLFEATMEGVETYLLNSALKFYRENSKVAIRRIMVDRSEEFMEGLFDFVDEVVGRPYKQDWIQLVRAAYNANESDDLSSIFCSQLIAAAYQRLGMIDPDLPSNNFVPSDFAGDIPGVKSIRVDAPRKLPSMRTRKDVALKESAGAAAPPTVDFHAPKKQRIRSVKIKETATKRDAKLNPYTAYIMEVLSGEGLKWIHFKRFNEFVLLDKELRKFYDGLPRLPKKVVLGKMDQSVIQKRRVALQVYLTCLVHSVVAECSILVDFLTIGRKGVQNLRDSIGSLKGYAVKKESEDGTKRKKKHKKHDSASTVKRALTAPDEKKKRHKPHKMKKASTQESGGWLKVCRPGQDDDKNAATQRTRSGFLCNRNAVSLSLDADDELPYISNELPYISNARKSLSIDSLTSPRDDDEEEAVIDVAKSMGSESESERRRKARRKREKKERRAAKEAAASAASSSPSKGAVSKPRKAKKTAGNLNMFFATPPAPGADTEEETTCARVSVGFAAVPERDTTAGPASGAGPSRASGGRMARASGARLSRQMSSYSQMRNVKRQSMCGISSIVAGGVDFSGIDFSELSLHDDDEEDDEEEEEEYIEEEEEEEETPLDESNEEGDEEEDDLYEFDEFTPWDSAAQLESES